MNIDPGTAAVTVPATFQIGAEARVFIRKLFGEAIEDLGKIFSDQVRAVRLKNVVRIIERTRKMLEDANLTPREVNLKFFFPFIEYSSLESEPEMVERWAALLANFSSSSDESVRQTIFPQLLSQLSSREAHILEWMAEVVQRNLLPKQSATELHFGPATLSGREFYIALNNLRRLGLIDVFPSEVHLIGYSKQYAEITHLGVTFLEACRKPNSVTKAHPPETGL